MSTHEYDESGEYTVILTVKDENGNKDIYERTIEIEKEDDDNGIPGFSLIILFISISLLVSLLKKKKHLGL